MCFLIAPNYHRVVGMAYCKCLCVCNTVKFQQMRNNGLQFSLYAIITPQHYRCSITSKHDEFLSCNFILIKKSVTAIKIACASHSFKDSSFTNFNSTFFFMESRYWQYIQRFLVLLMSFDSSRSRENTMLVSIYSYHQLQQHH